MIVFKVQGTKLKSLSDVRALVALARGRFTHIMVTVHDYGCAYPGSAYFPVRTYPCLPDLLTEAHVAGIKVIAWITPGYLYVADSTLNAKNTIGLPVSWTDFTQLRAAEVQTAVVKELVTLCPDIDAVLIDYIRAPQGYASYFTEAQVTAMVQSSRAGLAGTSIPLYSSGFDQGWADVLQDWPGWLSSGLVDMVLPMVYHWGGTLEGETAAEYELRAVYPHWPQDQLARICPIFYAFAGGWNEGSRSDKDAAVLIDEISEAMGYGFEGCGIFDNTAPQALIEAAFPIEEGDTMGVKDTIIAEAEKLEEQAAALLLIAASLRAQADALEAADVKAAELSAML